MNIYLSIPKKRLNYYFFLGQKASLTSLDRQSPTPIMPTNCADVKAMGAVNTGFHIAVENVEHGHQKLKVVW